MDENLISDELAAAIQDCWPDVVVGEFDANDSYFHDIHEDLEQDLARIPGATLQWQTEPDDDPPTRDWQSYHVFFLVPHGSEFGFETDAENTADGQPPGDAAIVHGKGWYGCAVSVSYAAPFAATNLSEFTEFEDGSANEPDMASAAYNEETGEPVDLDAQYLDILGEAAFARLQNVRARISAVLAKYQLELLDSATLDVSLPEMGVAEGVFLEVPISVRDAFFFRGE